MTRIILGKNSISTVNINMRTEAGDSFDLTGKTATFAVGALSLSESGTIADPPSGSIAFSLPAQSSVVDNKLYDAQLLLSGQSPIELEAIGQADGDSGTTPVTVITVTNSVVSPGGPAGPLTYTDSYVGQVEEPEQQNYFIDPHVVAGRTVNFIYLQTTAGTCDVAVKKRSGSLTTTMASASVSSTETEITSSGITGGSLAIGDEVIVAVTNVSSAENLQFAIGYTQ